MSVAGKKHDEWVAQTFCDFGTPGRKSVIGQHFSEAAANRRYKTINKIYGTGCWNCWQEMRDGRVINGERPPSSN